MGEVVTVTRRQLHPKADGIAGVLPAGKSGGGHATEFIRSDAARLRAGRVPADLRKGADREAPV